MPHKSHDTHEGWGLWYQLGLSPQLAFCSLITWGPLCCSVEYLTLKNLIQNLVRFQLQTVIIIPIRKALIVHKHAWCPA